MNYIYYKIGLERRLVYSRELRERNKRERNRRALNTRNTINRLETIEYVQNDTDNYTENYIDDSKKSLINVSLFDKSSVELNKFDDNFCVICQNDIKINSIMRILDCSHCFHINCIDRWFTTSMMCPICKFTF